ncbi:MAG: sigma-54 dependent transcriptional regulator [Moraxellaceae bacterium]|nr:sigma-54 dependent transcriptional regulator [Moraxellaceae bacterium]
MAETPPSLLVVDDDPLIVETLRYLLGNSFRIHAAGSRNEAVSQARGLPGGPDVALVDLGLPPVPHRPDEGLALIGELLAISPACKIIVLSGQNDDSNARHARTLGALDFIAKPAQPEPLRVALFRAARLRQQEADAQALPPALLRILGDSPAAQASRARILQLAPTRFPVLITGESGVGKELAARALHECSPQASAPFLALNCAAIAPGLIEATLFGHTRGAYTGAVAAQPGYFEEAAGGTLLLDEIGELPLELQPKLLRVLENGDFQRVGETQTRQLKARIVAATNRDLRQEVRCGRFRADLFHRLGVLVLAMPPLRELGQDRLRLLDALRRDLAAQMGATPFSLDHEAEARWLSYDFPGNVRELRNIVIRLLSRYPGERVGMAELEAELEQDSPPAPSSPAPESPTTTLAESGSLIETLQREGSIDLDAALRRVEREHIAAALHLARGNMSQAARMLGINRSTLYNRLETLARHGEGIGLDSPDAGWNGQ